MLGKILNLVIVLLSVTAVTVVLGARSSWADNEGQNRGKATEGERQTDVNAQRMLEDGKQTFRFDTFGDEAFWSDALQLHRAIAGANFGGVGPGVSPATALAVGLKVDSEALPQSLISQLKHGRVNLDDPATIQRDQVARAPDPHLEVVVPILSVGCRLRSGSVTHGDGNLPPRKAKRPRTTMGSGPAAGHDRRDGIERRPSGRSPRPEEGGTS